MRSIGPSVFSFKVPFVSGLLIVSAICLLSCSGLIKTADTNQESAEATKSSTKIDQKVAAEETADIIEFGTDGVKRRCKLLDIIEFEDNKYGILEDLADGAIAPMRFIDKGDKAIFHEIPTDDEFDRVTAHIKEMTKK